MTDPETSLHFDVDELMEALADMVAQHCVGWEEAEKENPELDSMALSSNAEAMRVLAKHGRLTIETDRGRGSTTAYPTSTRGTKIVTPASTPDRTLSWRIRHVSDGGPSGMAAR